jgi:agmatine/peptidylarginine deiminase
MCISHWIGLLAGMALACNEPPPFSHVEPGPRTIFVEAREGPPPPLLPAYETAAEKTAGWFADANDKYRIANKPWFANTVPPPPGQFRAMAEWETMQSVWTTYAAGIPGNKPVRRMFAEQTLAFVRDSNPPVQAYVIVGNDSAKSDFTSALKEYGATAQDLAKVTYVILPNQTIWHIDYGVWPLVAKQTGKLAFADFVYYQNRPQDDAIPTRLAQEVWGDATVYRMPFKFEGGNIQADGLGNCATSTRALANTGWSELKVKSVLKRWAACAETVIMKDITDDGTGHIDMFFKWLGPDAVMIGQYDDTILPTMRTATASPKRWRIPTKSATTRTPSPPIKSAWTTTPRCGPA